MRVPRRSSKPDRQPSQRAQMPVRCPWRGGAKGSGSSGACRTKGPASLRRPGPEDGNGDPGDAWGSGQPLLEVRLPGIRWTMQLIGGRRACSGRGWVMRTGCCQNVMRAPSSRRQRSHTCEWLDRFGWGAELAETGTWGHGFHGIGFRWTPGHLDDPGDRAGGSMRGVARQRAGKPQIETRLLEQGPGVSALLTAGWVACLPSLDLPGCALTVARRGDRGHRHSCLFCEQPLTGGAPARRCSLARCQPAPDWQP